MIVVFACEFIVTAEECPSNALVDAMIIRGVGCVDECFSGSSHMITGLWLYTVPVIYLDDSFLSTAKLGVP